MTARDGFPGDMDPLALDAGTADRLMTGSVDVADAPPPYRAVAGTLQALRQAPESWELAGAPAAVEQIAAAVVLERQARPVRRPRRSSSRVAGLAAAAVVVCGLPVTGGLASAGALPEPAQHLASTVLGKVGISVPTGAQDPADDGPPPTTSVPAPPSTTGSSSGAGGPGPDVANSPRGDSSPAAPGSGEGDHHGTPARGTPPKKGDGAANEKDGHWAPQAPDDGPKGGNGTGHDR
jgi:hypothetical protein